MPTTREDLTVELAWFEFKWCVDVANARMAVSNEKSMNHASTYERDHLERMTQEITGACAEAIVAKFLGKWWSPSVNTFHTVADITPNIEVRGTRRLDGCLPVRDNDPDDRWYFLAVGTPPKMTIAGYIRGSDAKQPQWLRNPGGHRPVFLVPQDALRLPKETNTDQGER
jgi:hypothetical protein